MKNFGSWKEVQAMDPFERLTLFYASCDQEGMIIDWTTGSVTRRPPQTLRDGR
jgi:hypothetical protein